MDNVDVAVQSGRHRGELVPAEEGARPHTINWSFDILGWILSNGASMSALKYQNSIKSIFDIAKNPD